MNIGMLKLLLCLGRELHPVKSSVFHDALLRQLTPLGGRETRFQSLRGDIPKGKEKYCKPQWVQDIGRTLETQGERQIAIQRFNREKKYAYSRNAVGQD
jgi:hypothetical protein